MPSPRPGFVRLRVQAGHDWDALVAYAVRAGLAGIEAMSGIPGTVGAAPVQNIGAYGQEIVQTLVEVELIDEDDAASVSTVPAAELGLGFRTSVLKHHYGSAPARRAVILSVTLELAEVGHDERPIVGDAAAHGARARVRATRCRSRGSAITCSRRGAARAWCSTTPTPTPTAPARSSRTRSCRHPSPGRCPDECPRWPVTPDLDPVLVIPLAAFDGYVPPPAAIESDVKVSAAWLIEHSGLRKGFKLPRSRAALSTKHALALTNRGERDGGGARRARPLHPGPRAVRVRAHPAARARAGRRRALGLQRRFSAASATIDPCACWWSTTKCASPRG